MEHLQLNKSQSNLNVYRLNHSVLYSIWMCSAFFCWQGLMEGIQNWWISWFNQLCIQSKLFFLVYFSSHFYHFCLPLNYSGHCRKWLKTFVICTFNIVKGFFGGVGWGGEVWFWRVGEKDNYACVAFPVSFPSSTPSPPIPHFATQFLVDWLICNAFLWATLVSISSFHCCARHGSQIRNCKHTEWSAYFTPLTPLKASEMVTVYFFPNPEPRPPTAKHWTE